MALDIAVLQAAYGANQNTNSGDNVYQLPDQNISSTFWTAIWDTDGTDTLRYNGDRDANLDLRSATLQGETGGGGFLSAANDIAGGFTIAAGVVIENAEGGSGNDVLTGNDASNNLAGNSGSDVLYGGTGNDTLDGGEGVDTASYADADNNVSVDIRFDGRSTQGAGRDSFISIENVTGSDFNDRLSGDSAANVLDGGTDNDTLRGQGGEDTLIGGEGDDNLRAGNDADVLRGDAGSDTLIGLSGDDELTGGIGDDFLFGGRDADTLFGNEGDDRLRGNQGNDVLEGGEGADDLRGGSGNDVLLGGADDDFMIGESGADTLDGGAGNDVLRGGFGDAPDGVRDTFVFAEGYDFDTIRDFENGTDLIDVQAFGFGSFAEVQALAEDRPSGLRIDFGGGDVLFINDVTLADLDQSDVIL